MGKYQDYDMSQLDLTTVRDYATYLALTANNQGINGQVALERWTSRNLSWKEYCNPEQDLLGEI